MGTSYTMSRLEELTPYCCRIRSKNDAGEGEFSKPKIFYTKPQPPPVIKGIINFLFILFWGLLTRIKIREWGDIL